MTKSIKEIENFIELNGLRARLANEIMNFLDANGKNVTIKPSFSRSKSQMYIYFQSEIGEMNITLDLMEEC